MPRLPPSLFRAAASLHPHAPLLLPTCRTIPSALSELRHLTAESPRRDLLSNIRRRARGHPLQYLLGTQPFGDLDLSCPRGVLIPRSETEEMAVHLAALVAGRGVTAVDLCSGGGCIALVLAREARKVLGLDLSTRAVAASVRNLERNRRVLEGADVRFLQGNVLQVDETVAVAREWAGGGGGEGGREAVDLVVANPPYVSQRGYDTETERSVRWFEPRSALVPNGGDGDAFYPVIGEIAGLLGAKGVVVEVGGWDQALRVKGMWEGEERWEGVAIWADFAGIGRTVVAWGKGWEWLEAGPNT